MTGSDKKVRCAIIGAGWWATTAHLPALREHSGAEIVAVQKRSLDEARKVAHDFGAAHAFTEMEEVLALQDLDAVIISSTPNVHYEQCRAALERGLHVLIEKPMTITVAQAKELVTLADSQGVQFAISCPWHYTPHGIEARRLIKSGELGQLKMISVLMTNFTDGLYKGLPWEQVFGHNPTLQNDSTPYMKPGQSSYSDPAIAGGGQIYCQVSHAAAYIGFLTDSQPTEVFARFDNADTQVDVYNVLNMKLQNGALVSLASTGATMLSERNYEVRIYGTKGMILLELWKGTMEFHDLECNVTKYSDIPEAEIYPMMLPAKNFIDSILDQESNGSPATLGLYAMKVIEAACQSEQSGCNIVIDS